MNTKYRDVFLRWACLAVALLPCSYHFGQTPFPRTGQVFFVLQNTNELQEVSIPASYNTIAAVALGPLPPGGLDAMGFRRSDNFLYGIGGANHHLFKIGQNAVYQDLGDIGLDHMLFYKAGDVSPDGQYFYSVGSDAAGVDVHLAKTDLGSAGFPTVLIPLSGTGHLTDITFDPVNSALFGFDGMNNRVVVINPYTGVATGLQGLEEGNSFYGLYFDAFGDLYAMGSTLYGIVDGFYQVNKNTGQETRLSTGPTKMVADLAACPYSVEMKSTVDPEVNLPCTDVTYTYSLANGSGQSMSGLTFLHALPPGFHLTAVIQNAFGVMPDTTTVPGSILLEHLSLPPGVRQLTVRLSVGDIPMGNYRSQALVKDLPPLYGSVCHSDNTRSPGLEDSTVFVLNRFDKDSLDFTDFICHGEHLLLETAQYGNNVLWNTGSSAATLSVSQGGLYRFVAGSTCEKIVVTHDVTSASCPFTIAIDHLIEPDTSFACSDLVFRYILSNDSGEPRSNVALVDSLPADFTFVSVTGNSFGGHLKPNLPPHVFVWEGMLLKEGVDTLDVKIHAGDVPPGIYKSRAVLFGLPVVMGPIRLSDDPYTLMSDSSRFHIRGALADSVFLTGIICKNAEITLDATDLGKTFLWDDGATAPRHPIDAPGIYHLALFDGCHPAQVFWAVTPGPAIQITAKDHYKIHQGESVQLAPQFYNAGDTLSIEWTGTLIQTLSCSVCPDPWAMPLENTAYGLKAANETCFDSVSVFFEVDQQRRIYAPNVFSPNDDGENDLFFLQSPDFGDVKVFNIYDRWGNLVFQTTNTSLQDKTLQWDGWSDNKPLPPGVYFWRATIEFVDGRQQLFSGDVTIIR